MNQNGQNSHNKIWNEQNDILTSKNNYNCQKQFNKQVQGDDGSVKKNDTRGSSAYSGASMGIDPNLKGSQMGQASSSLDKISRSVEAASNGTDHEAQACQKMQIKKADGMPDVQDKNKLIQKLNKETNQMNNFINQQFEERFELTGIFDDNKFQEDTEKYDDEVDHEGNFKLSENSLSRQLCDDRSSSSFQRKNTNSLSDERRSENQCENPISLNSTPDKRKQNKYQQKSSRSNEKDIQKEQYEDIINQVNYIDNQESQNILAAAEQRHNFSEDFINLQEQDLQGKNLIDGNLVAAQLQPIIQVEIERLQGSAQKQSEIKNKVKNLENTIMNQNNKSMQQNLTMKQSLKVAREQHHKNRQDSPKQDMSLEKSEIDDDYTNNQSKNDSIDRNLETFNEINNESIELLKNEDAEGALECLKKAEKFLEDFADSGKDVDRNIIIIVLYNQACCYQRMSMLEECSNYLDGTIFNLNQKQIFPQDEDDDSQAIDTQKQNNQFQTSTQNYLTQINNNYYNTATQITNYNDNDYGEQMKDKDNLMNNQYFSIEKEDKYKAESVDKDEINSKKLSISQKIFKLRYLCKCHLQLCAVQSQLNKHKDALHHGKMASLYCQELIRNSKTLCESYIGQLLIKTQRKIEIIQDNLQS